MFSVEWTKLNIVYSEQEVVFSVGERGFVERFHCAVVKSRSLTKMIGYLFSAVEMVRATLVMELPKFDTVVIWS